KFSFETPPLLLISFDGFRADYFTRNLTPTLKHLFECGVTTPHMISSFPSITFPNHYSIVTGLYPGYHGIVDNALFGVDPHNAGDDAPLANKKKLGVNDVGAEWFGGEPIWNTVHKAGKKSAISFWPGSEVPIQGLRPDYWQVYKTNYMKGEKLRIEEIINYLNLPSPERPDFYTFYYNNPDHFGHVFGPDSHEVDEILQYVDSLVIYLLKRLDEEGLLGCINIVFVSDHGMENLKQSPEFHANLASVMDSYPFKVDAVSSVVGHVYVEKEEVPPGKSLLDNFRVCRGGHPFAAWTRQDIPRRYHYTTKRAGSLIFESEPGSKFFKDKLQLRKGDHGYDPLVPHMNAIFGAIGPSFKKGVTVEPFQNVELYNLFVDLLQLPNRAKTNGTIGRLNDLLIKPTSTYASIPQIPPCDSNADAQCLELNPAPLLSATSNFCVSYNAKCRFELFNAASKLSIGTSNPLAKIFLITKTWSLESEALLSAFSPSHANIVRRSKAFEYIQKLIGEYGQKLDRFTVFVGAITDTNNNGLADDADDTKELTHFYIVLQKCKEWAASGFWHCEDVETAEYVPFILPIERKDYNCLKHENYLLRHTARLRDIELLTGFEFNAHIVTRTKLIYAI
uniref:NUC domain-containing protein n=1 Tax=Panagrellus redivivus TaxID=6233 RepID=A0A7E4ZV59_PANRE